MQESLLILGAFLTCFISIMTIMKFMFYTKSEVDKKIATLKQESDNADKEILQLVEHNKTACTSTLNEIKEKIYDKLVEAERENNKSRQEFYDRLNHNKQIFDDYNQHMFEAVAQLKQEEKELSANLLQFVTTVKDELKNDYINRYNDLLKIIGTKANVTDFDRLEQKFDKITETITELKTIVQMQMEDHK